MTDLKTLLFSEEELKDSQETNKVEEQKPAEKVHHDEVKPEETKTEPEKPVEEPEKKEELHDDAKPEETKTEPEKPVEESEEKESEEKHFDGEKEVHFRVKCAKSGDVMKEDVIKVDAKLSDAEAQSKVIEHLGGLRKDTVIEFFDIDETEVMTFDDLYFSEEELKDSDKEKDSDEDEKPAEKPEEKLHDDMTPEKKADTLKSLAGYLAKAEKGKNLSVAEKYFCDSMTKYFTEEEVKAAVEDAKKADSEKPNEEKVEVSKKEFDDMKAELESKTAKVKELEEAARKATEEKKPEEKVEKMDESKESLFKRLNSENGNKDLRSLARTTKYTIK